MEELWNEIRTRLSGFIETASGWAESPSFYLQLGTIGLAVVLMLVITALVRPRLLAAEPPEVNFRRFPVRTLLFRLASLLPALLLVVLLALTADVLESMASPMWLVRIAESAALVYLLFTFLSRFVRSGFIRALGRWVVTPLAALAVFGWLDDVTAYLDGISLSLGSVSVSVYAVLRTFVAGAILFWVGRLSNSAGKDAIRRQNQLDIGTREVFAKLFEISVFVVVFLLLLQVMGINLTALAVFGGALGVGLGFGLQQIASNFISGIIILLDRSLKIGDYVELEDGRSGTLRELNMRFGVVETYDGKDIVVPNEKFITSSYINWTHKDPRQRYAIEFQVAYGTDLDALFEDLRALMVGHEQVLSGPEYPYELQPDAEVAGFGDSGIDVLMEYWIEGVDDGKNRVEADILLSIYHLFRDKGYAFPFPQREVRMLGGQP